MMKRLRELLDAEVARSRPWKVEAFERKSVGEESWYHVRILIGGHSLVATAANLAESALAVPCLLYEAYTALPALLDAHDALASLALAAEATAELGAASGEWDEGELEKALTRAKEVLGCQGS
jgi:hypothetical protein